MALFALIGLGLAAYWGHLLRQSLRAQYAADPRELAGFARWLLGYVMLLAGVGGLGWINYRGPFRWFTGAERRWHYRAWLLILLCIFFEALQWRTRYEVEWVEENLLVAALGAAFVAGFTLVLDAARARRERLELLQQKTAAELDNLRAQLNPHFLFNALNTLYGEALQQGQERLADLIGELAGLLRFTLHQAQRHTVSLAEEIQFLQRYINLQLARLPHNPQRRVETRFDWDEAPAAIAPLLLIPFIENAFQYGLHPTRPCFVRIRLAAGEGRLRLEVENSLLPSPPQQGAGLGIANTRARLERLYGRRQQLSISRQADIFKVVLELPLTTSLTL